MDSVKWVLMILLTFAAQGITLFVMGQPAVCECGIVKLWEGVVLSSGNSQHLSDWYSFSHIIHGFAFYFLTWVLFPRLSWRGRLLIALGIEAGWEIFENTPWLIEHYRKQALAQGYIGDSILNSLSDTIMMLFGFLLARKMPVWATMVALIFLEAFVGFSIRDNLTLNIINLIHPFEFISQWQAGG